MGATIASSAVVYTLDELERLPENGLRREILRGELIEMPPAKSGHAMIAARIYDSLRDYLRGAKLGRALIEAGYQLFPDRQTWLQPDVSFYSAERAAAVNPDDYFQGAPDIAVEVISPSESASDIEAKTEAYVEAGARAVVLVFPDLRRVRIHLGPEQQRLLRDDDALELPGVLPGWRMPVRAMFSDDAEA